MQKYGLPFVEVERAALAAELRRCEMSLKCLGINTRQTSLSDFLPCCADCLALLLEAFRGSGSMKTALLVGFFIQNVWVGCVFAQEVPGDAELAFATSWIANTSQASSDEEVLIAAMLAEQYQPSIVTKFLSMEIAAPDLNKLRYSLIAYHCLLREIDPFCEDSSYGADLVALDPGNMEPQLYSMLASLSTGENEAALIALTKGNSNFDLNNYYFDKLSILRNRLFRSAYPADRVNAASELLAGAGAMYAVYSKVLSSCAERSKIDAEWKVQCLELGRRLENEGKTAMQNVFGFAIQRDSLGSSDADADERSAINARRNAFNAIRDEASEKLDWWRNPALKSDALYRSMAEIGEIRVVEKEILDLQ